MAQIQSLFFLRHLRAEATSHVLHFRRGELVRTGRGLSFWFYPMNAAIAEIPVDDRDLNYAFHGRTRDYQEVTVQGVLTYRVVDAERLAQRIDFAVDLARGTHVKQPLEQIAILLTGIAQKAGLEVMAELDVPDLLVRGYAVLGEALATALGDRRGIVRFAHAYAPLDEALARAVVDLSGRGFFVWSVPPELEQVWVTQEFPLTLVADFFQALADRARLTLHLTVLAGRNPHHVAEACFKAVAVALRQAVAVRSEGSLAQRVPSTKGTLAS